MVDHLEQICKGENTGIGYLFCVHNGANQTTNNFLGTLLTQLALQNDVLLKAITSCHVHHSRYKTRPTPKELSGLLHLQIQQFDKVYIVIDALDECPELDQTRKCLISEIRGLLPEVSLLVTSRDIPSIKSMFQQDTHFQIRAQEQDVKLFIESQLKQRAELAELLEDHDDVRSRITATVLEKSNGMSVSLKLPLLLSLLELRFLIAVLHMDSLAKEDNIRDLKESLQRLPEDLDKTYDDAMERIRNQDSRKLARAEQVFTLVSCAKRPLKLKQIRQALSIRRGDTFLDPEASPKAELMFSSCCGLVVVEDESEIVRLVHYTTEEYFKRKLQRYRSPEAHEAFSGILITYLSFAAFTSFALEKIIDAKHEIAKKRKDRKLLRDIRRDAINDYIADLYKSSDLVIYAAENWGHHAREAFTNKGDESNSCLYSSVFQDNEADSRYDLKQLIPWFLQQEANLVYADQIVVYIEDYTKGRSGWLKSVRGATNITDLQMAASFGLQFFVQYYLSQGAEVDVSNSEGMTALHKASKYGHAGIVKLLLDSGAAIELKDRNERSALSWAVLCNQLSVTRLLLQNGSDPRVNLYYNGLSAVSYAATAGNQEIMELIIEYDEDDVEKGQRLGDALKRAAAQGHEGIVRFLTRGGENWHISKTDLERASNSAATNGFINVLEILLKHGAEANAQDTIALTFAATEGFVKIVKILLNHGADVNARDAAAANGHVKIVKILLDHGADIGCPSARNIHPSAIARALNRGQIAAAKVLLERGGREYAIYNQSPEGTLLHTIPGTYGSGPPAPIIDLLLEHGADLEARDGNGRTPLAIAVQCQQLQTVEYLLKLGANLEARNNDGDTILVGAVRSGMVSAVRSLLERGADPEAFCSASTLPYNDAFEEDYRDAVKLVLEAQGRTQ